MIALLGINHKSAPISVREVYAFDPQENIAYSNLLKNEHLVEGVVIISTCNRTEIYVNSQGRDEKTLYHAITDSLKRFRKKESDFKKHFYFLTNDKAVEHLFKVASGLDSLVLGEEQIIGQVKDAFKFAQDNQLADCILVRLFIKATEAGKRVRTETNLSKGAASVSYAAVELCSEIYPDIKNRVVMLIGVGQTGELTLQCMLKKNQPSFYIANRTHATAQEKADKYGGTAIDFASIHDYLPQCDLVITATSSKKHIITKEIVEKSMLKRQHQPQVFIDLSVPSNVAENITEINNVYRYNVDDLEAVVKKTAERRKSSIDDSLKIINEVHTEFMEWLDFQNLTPTIHSIKESLKSVQQNELKGFKKYKKIREHELIDQYSEHISEKYAQMFIKKLKKVTDNGKKTEYIRVINDLFEIIENDK
ncbi:MAG TPA: glutamyl-tRNA reductase [Bacteroidales bacterium]